MHRAFRWLKRVHSAVADHKKGRTENPQNNNVLTIGPPGSGKTYLVNWLKEDILAGEHAKVVEAHASSPAHLKEILELTLPNGYYEHADTQLILDDVRERLKEGEYEGSVLSVDDLENVCSGRDVSRNLAELEDLIERAENTSLKRRLKAAYSKQETINDRLKMIDRNVVQNDGMPSGVRKAREKGLVQNFTVKVFVPISAGDGASGMPPDVEVPDFFVPFGIPVDDFKKWNMPYSLRMIFNDRHTKTYRDAYNNLVEVGNTTFADMKRGEIDRQRQYVKEVKVGNETIEVYEPESAQEQSMAQFHNYWAQMFNSEGVVCSSDFEHTLREQLKEALLDKETDIITLYTGYLRDEGLQKFVMTYFIETFRSIIENLSASEVRRLDRKFILSFLEAQEAIKKNEHNKKLTVEDRVFNRMMHSFMNQSRHFNTDIWVDAKPDDAHPMLASRAQHHIITRMSHDDFLEHFQGRASDMRNKAMKAFSNPHYQELGKYGYGFLYMNDGKVEKWTVTQGKYKGMTTYGSRLPCPRMTVEQQVDITNDDFSLYLDELGYRELGSTMTFGPYQDALFKEDWQKSEADVIDRIDKKREKRRKQQEQEEATLQEERKKNFLRAIETKVARHGIPKVSKEYGSWNDIIRDFMDEEEWDDMPTLRTFQNWLKEEDENGTTHKEKIIAEFKEEKGEDVDVEARKQELLEWEEFVFKSPSKDSMKRRARRKFDDLPADVAEDIAMDARLDMIDWLIDRQNNPIMEKEKWRQEVLGEEPEEEEPDTEEWGCGKCGTYNGPGREVCLNCGEHRDEVGVAREDVPEPTA